MPRVNRYESPPSRKHHEKNGPPAAVGDNHIFYISVTTTLRLCFIFPWNKETFSPSRVTLSEDGLSRGFAQGDFFSCRAFLIRS